jgi:hypothetical protein
MGVFDGSTEYHLVHISTYMHCPINSTKMDTGIASWK